MTFGSKQTRSANALIATDNMSPELRQCVHEYGYAIVNACFCAGVVAPNRIHQLVKEIWDGARQPTQYRERGGTLDWLLVQLGAPLNALQRVLMNNDLVIVPLQPSTAMIEASKAEVSGFNVVVNKAEKHRRRLTAAIKAGAREFRADAVSDLPRRIPAVPVSS